MKRSTAAIHGWLLLLPAMAILALFTHWPAFATLVDSFFSTPKGGREAVWVGVENYQVMAEDPVFWKAVRNNLLFAANLVSAMEVLVMGAKAGLDPEKILEVVNVSSGRSFVTTDRIPQTVLPRNFPERFATELLFKDVKLGIDEAERLDSPLYMAQTVRAMLAFAVSQGDGPIDCANLIKHFEGWAGTEFGARRDN